MDKVYSEINALIDTYESIKDSSDINTLLDIQDSLSIYSYRLAETSAENKSNFNKTYYIRKITHQRQVRAFLNEDKTLAMNKANLKADMSVQDLVEKELLHESIAYKSDILLKQLNKVLDSIRQRISYNKKEWELNKFQQK